MAQSKPRLFGQSQSGVSAIFRSGRQPSKQRHTNAQTEKEGQKRLQGEVAGDTQQLGDSEYEDPQQQQASHLVDSSLEGLAHTCLCVSPPQNGTDVLRRAAAGWYLTRRMTRDDSSGPVVRHER